MPVRIGVRDVTSHPFETEELVTPVQFDFLKRETWSSALAGAQKLFLVRPPAISNVKEHINPMLDLAAKTGIEHVVLLSILGAEKNPILPHHRIEKHLEATGLPYTFLRASFFMQNLSTTHRDEIRDQHVIAVPAGNGKTSFIDVRDIAAVAAKVLTEPGHEGRAYDLTGAEALSYGQVAKILSAQLGRRVTYTKPSLLWFVRRMRAESGSIGYALVTAGIYTTARLGMADRLTGKRQNCSVRPRSRCASLFATMPRRGRRCLDPSAMAPNGALGYLDGVAGMTLAFSEASHSSGR